MWDLGTIVEKNQQAAERARAGMNEVNGLPRTIKSSPVPRKILPDKTCEQCQNA